MKLRLGDTVEVMVGKDRGRRGRIEQVFPRQNLISVEKVNRFKKHLKPTRRHPRGGIVEIMRPISAANVMVVCSHCERRVRIGMKLVGEKTIRVCKRCGKALDENKRQPPAG